MFWIVALSAHITNYSNMRIPDHHIYRLEMTFGTVRPLIVTGLSKELQLPVLPTQSLGNVEA